MRQLVVFAAVARAGSFTDAARELRISQSALSRTVQEMERTLRVRLFERTTRTVRRTPEGDELLAVAERVVGVHRAEMGRLGRYLEGETGTVTIATVPSVAAVLLPPVISGFRARRPDIRVRVLDSMSDIALDRVAAGTADFAITLADRLPAGLYRRPLVRDAFFAALPRGHPLAERTSLRWRDLGGEPFIAIGADSSVRKLTDRAMASAGVQAAGTIEVGNVSTVGGLVAAGLGVSALPALVRVLMSFADIAHRPLTGPVAAREIGVVLPAGAGPAPAARRFLDLLESLPGTGHPLPADVAWAGGPD
ncbi:DNA-binding transcriptional LysR family regulator [Murinocardiopsis flavida]|uniref:DNA-binding transcriptional LysR family regulator n=1 Tax=Murinocardiopsis flavida TaxID=645275 RepID=A0A2P8DQ50_9ACTN|nr:DNA-binding transcriptional LysR family regulator [Murinocardiopsis flavida]